MTSNSDFKIGLKESQLANIGLDIPRPDLIKIPQTIGARYAHHLSATYDFNYYATYCNGFPPKQFHIDWIDYVRRYDHVCFMAPRIHGKTTYLNILNSLDLMVHHPPYSIYSFSSNEDMIIDILDRLDDFVQLPYYQDKLIHGCRLILTKSEGWSKTNKNFGNGSRLSGRGFASASRGPHPHMVICDDILSDKTYLTEEMMRRLFYDAISNMPMKKMVVIGTPQHFTDLLHQLFDNEVYYSKMYPAVVNEETQEVLWEEMFSFEWLMKKKKEIGDLAFSKEFLCRPLDDSASLFPYLLISQNFEFASELNAEKNPESTYVLGCDLAIGTTKQADYSVFTVLELHKDKFMRIAAMQRFHGLDYKLQLKRALALGYKYNCRLVYIENNAFQQIFEQLLMDSSSTLPIEGVKTGSEKHNIEIGIPSVRQMLENKKLLIPRGNDFSIEQTNVLVKELMGFAIKEGRVFSAEKHDDTVLSLWIALKAAREVESKRFWFASLDI